MTSCRVLSLAAVMLIPLPASAAETLWTEIVVRVYDSTGVSVPERTSALQIARSIVAGASVELVWRICDGPARPEPTPGRRRGDSCQAPLAPGELALRIIRSAGVPDDGRRELPLGDALVGEGTGGVLATVYADRVEWMAARTGVNVRQLLGRAIAHELGHLLMATSLHASDGLMRPVWSQSEIRRGHGRDWTFRPREVAAIQERTRFLALVATRLPDAGRCELRDAGRC